MVLSASSDTFGTLISGPKWYPMRWRALFISRHVIKHILNPRFLADMVSYDMASTTYQSLMIWYPMT